MTGYARDAWTAFIESGQPAAPVREVQDFQPAVIKLAKLCDWMVYHTHDSRRSEAGFPDLVLIPIAGTGMIAAELKVGDNATTAEQLAWLEAFGKVEGCEAVVWRPDKPPGAERFWRVETSEGADWGAIGRRLRGET